MINHPYSRFVAGNDPIEMLRSAPHQIAELAQRIGQHGFEKSYAPGKWSGKFILAHLADCEVAFGFRWRQVAYSPNLTVQPFDQDAWARNYDKFDAKWALGAFTNARLWNLEFLESLSKEAFRNQATHPERGELTLQDLIEITAGHDVNHIEQLKIIAAS